MEKAIPKVSFNRDKNLNKQNKLDIEVMQFAQLYEKLDQLDNHDPFAVHKIEFYLILMLTQNEYTHFVDFKSYTLKKGSALFVAQNQVHYFNRNLKQAKGYAIVVNGSLMEKYYFLSENLKLNRLFNYHIETPLLTQEDIGIDSLENMAERLFYEYNFPDNYAKAEILQTLLQVLLLQAERAKEFCAVNISNTRWLEVFSAFKNKLQQEYTITRNSRNYASKLAVSYKFLNDIVKQLTGKTVKTFIDDFVIVEIKRYLVSTALSIKEISYKTGFEEPANMIKFFKKHTQTTPFKFRQQL